MGARTLNHGDSVFLYTGSHPDCIPTVKAWGHKIICIEIKFEKCFHFFLFIKGHLQKNNCRPAVSVKPFQSHLRKGQRSNCLVLQGPKR